jgi:transcriptional regulator with XRE-family HTH domain
MIRPRSPDRLSLPPGPLVTTSAAAGNLLLAAGSRFGASMVSLVWVRNDQGPAGMYRTRRGAGLGRSYRIQPRGRYVMSIKTPEPKDIEVGRRVRALRLNKGMSQGKLAEALGLTFQQVQKYENGTNRMGAGRLQRIAEIFGVPIWALFGAQAPAKTPSESLFEFVDSAAAMRLLRAYSRISNPKFKQALVTLAEEAAANERGRR